MHKDASERVISKGDFVVYSVGSGRRSSDLRFAVVTALREKSVTRSVYNATTKTYDSVSETEYKIQVITAEKSSTYDRQTGNYKHEWRLQGMLAPSQALASPTGAGKARLATLDRLERIIVVQPHQIHPEARTLLEQEMVARGIS